MKNKEILNPSGSDNPLKKVLEQEIFSKTLQVKNNNGVLSLFSSNGEILKVKNGCLRELTLYETQKLPEFFLNRHPWIEKVSAPFVSICLKEGFRECPNLKEIDFKELKSFDFSFCADTRCQIKAKTLEEKGIRATVRRRLGADINASCGQLRRASGVAETVGGEENHAE